MFLLHKDKIVCWQNPINLFCSTIIFIKHTFHIHMQKSNMTCIHLLLSVYI